MPETDGFHACKEIRKMKDIPVLMLSSRGTEYDKLFGFEVGVDDYLTKPFSVKELIVKQIVTIHGGEYGAKSEVGSGSEFWVKFRRGA